MAASRSKNGFASARLTLLLWFPFPRGPPGFPPAGIPAADMRNRLQPHILRGLGRERRAQTTGAVEDELPVFLEDRLGIGRGWIDPELQHAARAGERAGNFSVALDLAGVADVNDHDVVALGGLDRLDRAQRLDLC